MHTGSRAKRIILTVVIVVCVFLLPLMGMAYFAPTDAPLRDAPSFYPTFRPRTFYPPSLALDGDRIHFFQADYSLTTLDLATGRVLFRSEMIKPESVRAMDDTRVMGNLIACHRFIVDKRDGKTLVTKRNFGDADLLLDNRYFFTSGSNPATLNVIDTGTGDIRALATLRYSGSGYIGDFTNADAPSGATPPGEKLPVVTPANVEGTMTRNPYFIRKRSRIDDREKAETILRKRFGVKYRYVFNATLLPGDGAVGYAKVLSFDDAAKRWNTIPASRDGSHSILLFADETGQWERRIN